MEKKIFYYIFHKSYQQRVNQMVFSYHLKTKDPYLYRVLYSFNKSILTLIDYKIR